MNLKYILETTKFDGSFSNVKESQSINSGQNGATLASFLYFLKVHTNVLAQIWQKIKRKHWLKRSKAVRKTKFGVSFFENIASGIQRF